MLNPELRRRPGFTVSSHGIAFRRDAPLANASRPVLRAQNTMDEPAVDATIPRACSDVFRLWTSVAVGALWSVAFVVALVILGSVAVQADMHAEFRIEIGLGLQLIAWNAFAVTYLVLGVRAFSGCDRDELVRRVHGSPLPRSALPRWLLAGGGGQAWAVVIAVGAFASMVRALVEESTTTPILAFAGVSVLLSLLVIAFSFALHYARHDIEQGGLRSRGPDRRSSPTTSTWRSDVRQLSGRPIPK